MTLCYITLSVQDIIWKYKNLTISDNSHYAISKRAKVDGVVSSLTISGLSQGDFGSYKCLINNGYGEDIHTVNLDRIGKFSFLNFPKKSQRFSKNSFSSF